MRGLPATPTPPTIPVAWLPRPFGPTPLVVPMRAGRTVADMVDLAIAHHGLPDRFRDQGRVRINDIDVPRHLWPRVRPRVGGGDVVVTFHLALQGGGDGGGKNPIAAIALIAVLVLATAVSGGLLGGASTVLFGTLTLAQAAGTAIAIGGSLLIAALTPPPKLAAPEPSQVTDNELKAASLTGNVLAPGAAIPRVIGTRRLFPPFICEPLAELVGDTEYVEAVMALAGPHALSALRAGDVTADDIAELDYQLVAGLPGDYVQGLVTRQSKTNAINLDLSRHRVDTELHYQLADQGTPANACPQWQSFVSRHAPDEVWLRMVWAEGLFLDANPTGETSQPVRIRFRRRGDVSWTNGVELHFSCNKPGPFQKDIRLIWGTTPSVLNVPEEHQAPVRAYKHVPGQSSVSPSTSAWDADSYFSAGAGNHFLDTSTYSTSNVRNVELYDDRAILWLAPGTFAQDAQYEIQVMIGEAYVTSAFDITNYKIAADHDGGPGSQVHDLFLYYYDSTNAQARVTTDQSTIHSRVIMKSVASIWHDNPVQTDNVAQIAVRVRGRSLEQFSVLAAGYVYDWNGTDWATLTTTSNPAPHYRDVLAGALNSDPLPADLIDDDDLVAWRTHCNSNSYAADMVVDGRAGLDVLNAIAGAGYGRPRQSETWGVLIDKDRSGDSPVQIFSPRNLGSLRFEKPFSKRPTGFRVRFDDADDDYIQAEEIVLDPLNPYADETRLEDIRYDAIVDRDAAIARAEFDLKQADLRLAFYHATADVEALVCRRGDLVGVQHDVLYRQAGFARVRSVRMSGSNVAGINLDATVPVVTEDAWSDTALAWSSYGLAWSAPRTGVAIRLRDGTLITKEVTAADSAFETRHLNFVTPFAAPAGSALAENCLVTAGPLASEYQRMLVFSVAPQNDYQAEITFVPEAPELWS